MTEILYLLLGWLLGLLSPRIIDAIQEQYHKKGLATAFRSEARDLQYRIACASYMLARHCGSFNRDYLAWLKSKLDQYTGNEPTELVGEFIENILTESDEKLIVLAQQSRAADGVGLSLKLYKASFIENNIATLVNFSSDFQVCIHEFLNHLSILNQQIQRAANLHQMTFDSSIKSECHPIIKSDLEKEYEIIQRMCILVCNKLQQIIDFDENRI